MTKIINNSKGIFFTLAIILLLIPLLLFVSFYINTSKTEITTEIGRVRCEELHYWVEDIKKDLQRAVVIFGRRAAIYTIGKVVDSGSGMDNYTFQCNSQCGIDCDDFTFPENGSEAAITELVLCGTLYSQNVTYMVNHTLREWIEKIYEKSNELHFSTNITLTNIQIVPKDAWNFAIIMDNEITAKDENEMCFYKETTTSVTSITSIIGLEDTLFPLNTNSQVTKYINNCTIDMNLTNTLGNGTSGTGNGTGTIILYSNIGGGSLEDRVCNLSNKGDKIIVFDQAVGLINNPNIESCLNDYAGAIDYQDVGGDPNITSPFVYGTGDLNLSDGGCIWIENYNGNHFVSDGRKLTDFDASCYEISNLDNYGQNCSVIYPEGGSFFDRLDGKFYLSDKYVNQSLTHFNESKIGLISLIDIYELIYHGIELNQNATWVDYLYWQNVNGTPVQGVCNSYGLSLRLDCQHLEKFGATTTTTLPGNTTTTTTTTTTVSTTTTTTTTPTASTTTTTTTPTTTTTTTPTTTTTTTTTPTTTTTTTTPTTTTTTTTPTTTTTTTTPTTTTTTSTTTTTTFIWTTTTPPMTTTTIGW